MTKISASARGGRKQAMTLDELEEFCARVRGNGATGAEPVAGSVTFGGKLRGVTIELGMFAVKPEE